MSRLIGSRLIWISTVYKFVSEFTWCPKFHDFTLLLLLFSDSTEINQTAFNTYVNFSRPQNSNKRIEYQNASMWEQTRHILYQFYKPFNRALANLLEDPKFDYGPY